jgi:hypothetical protein
VAAGPSSTALEQDRNAGLTARVEEARDEAGDAEAAWKRAQAEKDAAEKAKKQTESAVAQGKVEQAKKAWDAAVERLRKLKADADQAEATADREAEADLAFRLENREFWAPFPGSWGLAGLLYPWSWNWEGRFGSKLFGVLLSALAVTMGAPFWYDVLNRLINVRPAAPKRSDAKPDS